MAPADAGDFLLDEDDDDFFGEFNPHPYQGGYNLAATFGAPLPPSSNICYPVSSSSAAPAAAVPATPSPPSPTPEPEKPEVDEEPLRDLAKETPDVSPSGAAREGKVRKRKGGFWKKCERVLDFLFCYKDPYEERRTAVDSYVVVPVCVYRKERGEDAFSGEAEVAPPSVGVVEADDATGELVQIQTNDLAWHSNNRDEDDTYSQPMSNSYYTPFAQSYGLHGVLGKPDWFFNFSYSESHQPEEFQHEAALSYDIECKISDQPNHCHHHHCYIQSLDVQVEPTEPVSSERLEYYEHFSTYRDQSDIHILETPAYAHSIQSYTRTSDLPLEPFKPSYSQNWGFYDAYTQGNAVENDKYSIISGECGRIEHLFISPFYPGETGSFELAPGDEHASFEHNWHNLIYRNMPMDDVSLITQPAEHSYSMMNGSSWPFKEHSAYHI